MGVEKRPQNKTICCMHVFLNFSHGIIVSMKLSIRWCITNKMVISVYSGGEI